MTWSLYRWTWRLEAPLYIGMPPTGSVNRCRLYVPARALWGAITAEIARAKAVNAFPEYQKVGGQVRDHMRFTYLFPAQEDDNKWLAWLPRHAPEEGLVWQREDADNQRLADRRFRMRLLSTRPSTAIEPSSDTAAEGSLRETECMNTHWRGQDGRPKGPVALVGYVFLKDALDNELRAKLEELDAIRIGGDTRYGLGRLIQMLMEPATPADCIFGRKVDLESDSPIVQSSTVLAHTTGHGCMYGAQEALSGWDAGAQMVLHANGSPWWTPGSRVSEKGRPGRFHIDELGTWRLEDKNVGQTRTNGRSDP